MLLFVIFFLKNHKCVHIGAFPANVEEFTLGDLVIFSGGIYFVVAVCPSESLEAGTGNCDLGCLYYSALSFNDNVVIASEGNSA